MRVSRSSFINLTSFATESALSSVFLLVSTVITVMLTLSKLGHEGPSVQYFSLCIKCLK